MALAILAGGCNSNPGNNPSTNPSLGSAAPGSVAINLSCDGLPSAGTVSPAAELPAGSILTITMCDVGSDGGYQWAEPAYDGSALALVGERSIAPPNQPWQVGASGSSVWLFQALRASDSAIVFADRRVWETDVPPFLRVVVSVKVIPGGFFVPLPVITAPTSAPSATATPVPSATATPAEAPLAPTDFTANQEPGFTKPCPTSVPDADICTRTDLAWSSEADPSTRFRVYEGWTGEGPGDLTCPTTPYQPASGDELLVLETPAGARSAILVAGVSVGGGVSCLWLSAINAAGESPAVPATVLNPSSGG